MRYAPPGSRVGYEQFGAQGVGGRVYLHALTIRKVVTAWFLYVLAKTIQGAGEEKDEEEFFHDVEYF